MGFFARKKFHLLLRSSKASSFQGGPGNPPGGHGDVVSSIFVDSAIFRWLKRLEGDGNELVRNAGLKKKN